MEETIAEIQNEILSLEKFKQESSMVKKSRQEVKELVSNIFNFNHVFTNQYKHAQRYYYGFSNANLLMRDAFENLEKYSESSLKGKDDKYFNRGLEDLKDCIDFLIKCLKEQVEKEMIAYKK